MKNLFILITAIALLCCTNLPKAAASVHDSGRDPEVVASVDISKYAGFWYEIAHKETFFQRDCKWSHAAYQVASPTSITVHNVCHREDGSVRDIDGTARILDTKVPGKLRVRFNFFLRGDYWIVGLDPNYQWAVVSGPKKESLFILARQAPMAPALLQEILDSLKHRGFDLSDLVLDQY